MTRLPRVEIPAYADHWMMGDRYGAVVQVLRCRKSDNELGRSGDIYEVKLDKSGLRRRYWADDCTEIT